MHDLAQEGGGSGGFKHGEHGGGGEVGLQAGRDGAEGEEHGRVGGKGYAGEGGKGEELGDILRLLLLARNYVGFGDGVTFGD